MNPIATLGRGPGRIAPGWRRHALATWSLVHALGALLLAGAAAAAPTAPAAPAAASPTTPSSSAVPPAAVPSAAAPSRAPTASSATAPAAPATTVTVGLLAHYPPHESWPAGGEASGYDVDLLRRLEAAMPGTRFEFVRFTDFGALDAELRSGRVALATSMAQTPERERALAFSTPYVEQRQALVARRDVTSVVDAPDLGGRRLVLVSAWASADVATTRWPLAEREFVATPEAAIRAVRERRADLFFGSLPNVQAIVGARADLRVLRTFSMPAGQLRLATAKSNAALIARLDEALLGLNAADREALAARWLRPPAEAASAASAPVPGAAAAGAADAPLRVGYFRRDPPFTSLSPSGEPQGVAIELFAAVAQHAGLRVGEWVPVGLAEGLQKLRERKLDVALGMAETAERRRELLFVGPYRSTPLAIVSPHSLGVSQLSELHGRRLAMVKSFFAGPLVRRLHPSIEIVECASFDPCLDLVAAGGAEATVYPLHALSERIDARGRSALSVTGIVAGFHDEDMLTLAPGSEALAQRLRAALDIALERDLPPIQKRWATSALEPEDLGRRLRPWLAGAAALLAAAGLGWWGHSRRMRREVRRADALHAQAEGYLAFMAHEVRNALQAVGGAVALLQRPAEATAGRGAAPERALLAALSQSARSTLGLLDALLERHRFNEGRLSLRTQAEDLRAVVGAVAEEMQPMAQAKGLPLRFEPAAGDAAPVMVDALRLQLVVRNLLVNALKFSDSGTVALRASQSVDAGRDDRADVRIDVVDQGPGLDDRQRAALFDRFRSAGGDRPGTGLGLNLSRDIVHAMGGSLEAHGTPGLGTTFSVRLMLPRVRPTTAGTPVPAAAGPASTAAPATSAAAAAPPTPRRSPDATPARVLLVEDSPVYALVLREMLVQRGMAVLHADTVDDAERRLQDASERIDVVLCDWYVGELTVETLVARLPERLRPGAPDAGRPGWVVMSASLEHDAEGRLAALGVEAAVLKDGGGQAVVRRVVETLRARDAAFAAGRAARV